MGITKKSYNQIHRFMETLYLKKDLIEKLLKLDDKNKVLLNENIFEKNFSDRYLEVQNELSKLKKISPLFSPLAYALMLATCIVVVGKIIGYFEDFNMNKAIVMILVTILNFILAFNQKLRIAKLKKQIMVFEILSNLESESKKK